MLKYSIMNWIYGDEPLEKTLQRLSKYKYDGISIRGEPEMYDVPKVCELLESYDLEVASIDGMYPGPVGEKRDFANPDEEVRKRAVEYVKRCTDFAHGVGAPLIVVLPTPVAKTKPLAPVEKEWKWAVASVKEGGTYAKDKGIQLAIAPSTDTRPTL